MVKVLILMATYESSDYILEQLRSIQDQDFNGVIDIQINDDNSKDDTLKIIAEFSKTYAGTITVTKEHKGGHLKNFMYLLYNAQSGYDYYMFSDHDDFWNIDKVSRAVSMINKHSVTTYGSAVMIADENLVPLYPERDYIIYDKKGLEKYILTYTQGCTLAIRGDFFSKISLIQPNLNILTVHDFWISLVSSMMGDIYYDKTPTMLYRIHQKNAVGNIRKVSKFHRLFHDIGKRRREFKGKISVSNEFLRVCGKQLSNKQIKEIKYFTRRKYLYFRVLTLLTFNYKPIGNIKTRMKRRYFFILGAV